MQESAWLGHPANGADANVDLGEEKHQWRADAACRGLGFDVFFPEAEDGPETQNAKRICSTCPVVSACLEYALAAKEDYGVWGGTTPRERRTMRRRARTTSETA